MLPRLRFVSFECPGAEGASILGRISLVRARCAAAMRSRKLGGGTCKVSIGSPFSSLSLSGRDGFCGVLSIKALSKSNSALLPGAPHLQFIVYAMELVS